MAYYAEHKADFTAPYDGICELLKTLKRRHLLLAVASNKYHAATKELIPEYFGEGLFDFVYGQREGIPVKPDPTIVFDIMKEAGVTKEEVLYVGDSGVDMQTAVNSGVLRLDVTWDSVIGKIIGKRGSIHCRRTLRDYEVGSLVNGVEVKYL